jgi:hypothetical protein
VRTIRNTQIHSVGRKLSPCLTGNTLRLRYKDQSGKAVYPYCCDIPLKSNKNPLPLSATLDFSPYQEMIFSFCYVNRLHSLAYQNAFLLRFFHTFTLKLQYFRKIGRKLYAAKRSGIITAYCENRTKHKYALWAQCGEILCNSKRCSRNSSWD